MVPQNDEDFSLTQISFGWLCAVELLHSVARATIDQL